MPDRPYADETPLLRVTGLEKHFSTRRLLWRRGQPVRAVDGISFDLRASETLGLVGESGCGKSTAGQAVLRLIEPGAGTIEYDGQDITHVAGGELRRLRRELQIIFQDPYASLNPRMTVFEIVSEPWRVFREIAPRNTWRRAACDLLERVGLNADHANRYPHQFSGGQRQRIGIARALAMQPRVIVCDEPVSALDVSVQAQVINLLRSIQRDTGVAYLFISHDLSVVRHLCDRVMVMYLGRCVEVGPTSDRVFNAPTHPYTRALIDAVPVADPRPAGSQAHRPDRRGARPQGLALGLPVPDAVLEGTGPVCCPRAAPRTEVERHGERVLLPRDHCGPSQAHRIGRAVTDGGGPGTGDGAVLARRGR